MLKFNIKFIVLLLFILFVNSTTVFANNNSDLENLEREYHNLTNQKTELLKQQNELLKKQNELLKQLTNKQNLTQELIINITTVLTNISNTLIIIQNNLDTINKNIDKILHDIEKSKNTPTSIYFTGQDRVWKWHPSFDYASITIHHRVKIHTRPSIYAPVRGWTEHEDIFISIGDIQSGPGSIRGWGRPVSYKDTKDGWINLDQLNDKNNLLWCIGQYDGTVIRYWHWENGVTKFHDEAYCVDPR